MGFIALVAGVVVIIWPDKSLIVISIIFGSYLLVIGLVEIGVGLFGTTRASSHRILYVLIGLLALIAGVLILRRPTESLIVIALAFGIYLIVAGTAALVRIVDVEHKFITFLGGLIYIIGGILIVAWPGIGLVTLAVIISVTLIVRGLVDIWLGFHLRGGDKRGPATV